MSLALLPPGGTVDLFPGLGAPAPVPFTPSPPPEEEDFLQSILNISPELADILASGQLVLTGFKTDVDALGNLTIIPQIGFPEEPKGVGGVAGPSPLDIRALELRAEQIAQEAEQGRAGIASNLLRDVLDIQRDPFSVVPALQLAGAAGGGTQAPANALALTRGEGIAPDLGGVVGDLVRELTQFTGATPINPNSGLPFTPGELQFLRLVDQQNQPAQPPVPGGTPRTAATASAGVVDQILPTTTAAVKPLAQKQPALVRSLTPERRANINKSVKGVLSNGSKR